MYSCAIDMAGPLEGRKAVDLYCGIGTITLALARRCEQAVGVEIVPQAIEDARENAGRAGLSNVRFICADAKAAAIELHRQGFAPDVIVCDPPRKGMDAGAVDAVLRMMPEKVVYIACDCASLARDAKAICQGGYRLGRVEAFDMFPKTANVECAALLLRER